MLWEAAGTRDRGAACPAVFVQREPKGNAMPNSPAAPRAPAPVVSG